MADLNLILRVLRGEAIADLQAFRGEAQAVFQQIATAEAQTAAKVTRARKSELDQQLKDAKKAQRDKSQAEQDEANLRKAQVKNAVDFAKREEQQLRDQQKRWNAQERQDDKIVADAKKRAIKETADAARAAAVEARKGHADVAAAAKGQASAVMNVATAYTAMRIASLSGQFATDVMKTMGNETRRTRDYVMGLVESMESARDRAAEILAMRGQTITGANTAVLARQAAQAGVTVEQHTQVNQGLENYVGQYVARAAAGEDEMTPDRLAAAGKKITGTQAEELAGFVSRYGVGARRQRPEDAAKLMGALVARSAPGVSTDDLKTMFAQVQTIGEKATGRTSPVDSQIASSILELAPANASRQELFDVIKAARVENELNPGQGATNTRAAYRALSEIRTGAAKEQQTTGRSRMDELGLTKDMSFRESIEQMTSKMDQFVSSGQGDDEDFLAKYVGKEVRELRSVRQAVSSMKGGVWDRIDNEVADVNAGTAEQQAKDYLASEAGQAQVAKTRVDAAKIDRGATYAKLAAMRTNIQADIISGGEHEVPQAVWNAAMTAKGEEFGQGDYAEQWTNSEVARRLNEQITERAGRGNPLAQQFLRQHNVGAPMMVDSEFGPLGTGMRREALSSSSPPQDFRDAISLLSKIEENSRATAKQMAPRNMNAPPPQPQMRN